jgi:mono/diheme cytochrome c family protein
MKRAVLFFVVASVVVACLAYGQSVVTTPTSKRITLPPEQMFLTAGPGMEKTAANCGICHSTDYINMQPKMSKAQWTAEVNKMIKVMGAPISADDAKVISNYLAANYGTGN